MSTSTHYDVVVVGAGIIGLAHAYHAHQRGLAVAVVDHAETVAGASVQNFGHACISAQSGDALTYARAGRHHWLDLSRKAGFWASETGTHCVARHDDEFAVLEQFAQRHGPDRAQVLDRDEILERLPISGTGVVGGLYLPEDLQVDPRTAAPAIARWLHECGVDFHWRTAATAFEPGVVHTSRGHLTADTVFVTVNYDIDRLFPELAETGGLLRCRLHMLRAVLPSTAPLPTPLFTGWSLLRYSGFADLPATPSLAQRLQADFPDAVELDLHQMYTPQPDGSILIGDTHDRDVDTSPFQRGRVRAVIARSENAFRCHIRRRGRAMAGRVQLRTGIRVPASNTCTRSSRRHRDYRDRNDHQHGAGRVQPHRVGNLRGRLRWRSQVLAQRNGSPSVIVSTPNHRRLLWYPTQMPGPNPNIIAVGHPPITASSASTPACSRTRS